MQNSPNPLETFFPPLQAAGEKEPKENEKDPEKDGPVRTQAVGEAPGEDLGYDPAIIPTEKIPVDED